MTLALADPDRICMVVSEAFFHPVVTRMLLTAVVAAVMSTADSQLLLASAVATGAAGERSELHGDGHPCRLGCVTVDVAAGAAENRAGNSSVAADQFSIAAELTPVPTLPVGGALALAALLLVGSVPGALATTWQEWSDRVASRSDRSREQQRSRPRGRQATGSGHGTARVESPRHGCTRHDSEVS